MSQTIQQLVADAKRSKYSLIQQLSEEDALSIWHGVSEVIEKFMLQSKGVCLQGFGSFTFSQRKTDYGNKVTVVQRPVFVMAETFLQTHSLQYSKQYISSNIPIVPFNYTLLANSTPWDRTTVENCVKEILQTLSKALLARKQVELDFSGVSRLHIREKRAKMKFFKAFINSIDITGHMENAFKSCRARCNTAESSIITGPCKPDNPRVVLPKIVEAATDEENAAASGAAETGASPRVEKKQLQASEPGSSNTGALKQPPGSQDKAAESPNPKRPATPSQNQQTCSPVIKDGESSAVPANPGSTSSSLPLSSNTTSRPQTCSHTQVSGQDLCYLCHQRNLRNVPLYLTEERRAQEKLHDKMLYEYTEKKDAHEFAKEKFKKSCVRKLEQEMAQFNLMASERKKQRELTQTVRASSFHPSYVFQHRPLTPPQIIAQRKYHDELNHQVDYKQSKLRRMSDEEREAEKLERRELAQELAKMEEKFRREAILKKTEYQQALDDQMKPKTVQPSCSPTLSAAAETQPVFGVHDTNPLKLDEQRNRAKHYYHEQLSAVAAKQQKQKDAINKMKKEEAERLLQIKAELLKDISSDRKEKWMNRKFLEKEWQESQLVREKKLLTEQEHSQRPSNLLLDQCKAYLRCQQCQRKRGYYGQSNVLTESRYISGSRLMV